MELPGTPELGNAVPGCWIRMQHQMSKHRPSHSRFASGIASAQSPAARAALHWRRGGGDTGEELVTAVPSVQCPVPLLRPLRNSIVRRLVPPVS